MIKKIFTRPRLIILLELLVLFAISLSPFFWLRGDEVITGHDTGAPLYPLEHFKDRLFVWTNRWGLSADQTYTVGAFFIHGLEAFFNWLGFSLQKTEQLNYVFWLFLPGVTMYFFARAMFKGRRYLPLIASVFFMLNHFLLQGWFVTERTKFSTYAALPLILLIMFKFFQGKLSFLSAGILSAFVLFILNGGGNLPLFGALFILIPFTIFFFNYLNFSFRLLKNSILYLLTTTFFTFILSSFWLIPYAFYVAQEYNTEVARAGGMDGVIGWAIEISKNTSFLNLMRLQGIPDWYNNPFHTYSNIFLNNWLLIAISFLFPLLAFGTWFVIKNIRERLYVVYFMFVGLIGMIFTAGMHPPTGFIYEVLLRFVPGFVMFRTPFYKFAPLIWLAFSILIAFFLDELLKRSAQWQAFKAGFARKIPLIAFAAIVGGIILYNYPIFSGKFFEYEKGSMRVVVPEYIFQFREWADGPENRMDRGLLLPGLRFDNKIEIYNWGYFSLATLTTLMTRETFVINAFYNTATEDIIINSLYENLLNNEEGWDKLSALMGIKNFVIRGDFKWDAVGTITRRPEDYEPTLKASSLVDLSHVFGKWKVYSFKDGFVNPLISGASDVSFVQGDPSFTRYLTSLPNFDQHKPLYFESQNEKLTKDKNFYISKAESIYLLPQCISCNLKLPTPSLDPAGPLVLPGSPLYKFVENKEKDERKKAITSTQQIDFLLNTSVTRLLEARRMIDFRNDIEYIPLPLKENLKLLKELKTHLMDRNMFTTQEGNEALIKIEGYLDREQALLEYIFEESPYDVEKEVNEIYAVLNPMIEQIKSWEWRTTNENDKKYIISVDKEGEYKLWLRRDPLELPQNVDPMTLTFTLTVDGNTYIGRPEQIDRVWILLRRLNLEKGIHKVTFSLPPIELFKGEIQSTDGTIPNYLTLNNGVYTLAAQGDKKCIIFPIKNLVSGTPYRVSFKHRKLSGDQDLRVYVSQKNDPLQPFSTKGDRLEGINNFRDYRNDVQLIESNEIYLNICTEFYRDPLYTQQSTIEIKDLSVRKLSSPVFVFEGNTPVDREAPQITFSKINQTKYKISVKNANEPFFITFSQRFSRDWKLYFDSGKYQNHPLSTFLSPAGFFSVSNLFRTPYDESKHFMSNAYANSWYIDRAGDSEIVIEYRGQLRFYVAATLTVFLVVISILIVVWDRKRKRKK